MKTNAIAKKPTENLSFGDRVFGRLVQIELGDPNEFGAVEIDPESTTDLAADVFWNLYKRETKPRDDVPPERRINQSLIRWMRETPGFEKSRGNSIANLPASAMSAATLTHYLKTDDVMGELLKQQQQLDEMAAERDDEQQRADMFNAAADAAETDDGADGDEPGDNGSGLAPDEWREMANERQQHADALSEQIAALADAMEQTVETAMDDPITSAAMSAATRESANDAEKMARIMAGFGLSGYSDVKNDPAAALELTEMIDEQIAEIAEMAGRVKGFALKSFRERVQTGPVLTRTGVTKRIDRLMPSELALLRPDAPTTIRAAKMAELVESGLLGYLPTGDGERAGDFVYGLDESGSMGIGRRLVVGRAVGLGLAMAAAELGRGFVLFNFAADRRGIRVVTSNDDWRDLIEWASYDAGGGTDFDMAIDVAIEQLRKMDGAKNADLVFASDGEGRVTPETIVEWNKFKSETGARLFYVPVDTASEKIARDGGSWFNIGEIADDVFATPNWDNDGAVELAGKIGGSWN